MAPEISHGGNFSYDEKGEFYSTTTVYGYIKRDTTIESYKCLMTILNSQLFWWYLVNTGTVLANGYFRYKPNYIKSFPLPDQIKKKDAQHLEKLADKILELKRRSTHADISKLEKQLDAFIYNLYNLADEEIAIIIDIND